MICTVVQCNRCQEGDAHHGKAPGKLSADLSAARLDDRRAEHANRFGGRRDGGRQFSFVSGVHGTAQQLCGREVYFLHLHPARPDRGYSGDRRPRRKSVVDADSAAASMHRARLPATDRQWPLPNASARARSAASDLERARIRSAVAGRGAGVFQAASGVRGEQGMRSAGNGTAPHQAPGQRR